MADEATSSFAEAIQDHLELKRRNAVLDYEMPLSSYIPKYPNRSSQKVAEDVGPEDEDTLSGVAWPE